MKPVITLFSAVVHLPIFKLPVYCISHL